MGNKPKNTKSTCTICSKRLLKDYISCSDCNNSYHHACLDLTAEQVKRMSEMPWQCEKCTVCVVCATADREDLLVLCDECDRATHTYCATPKLENIPDGKLLLIRTMEMSGLRPTSQRYQVYKKLP